ncbi:hypothetical protein GY45DRAFT_278716 [Cubamyces sp. BRFM 1775]|nr:hypothetical protein GY45DRAFT_278716 [Cubamyces sp. BRFM 1775]
MASSDLSMDGLAARQTEVTQQQVALARELISISHTLNASRPANKLPVELLNRIFHLLQMHNGTYNEGWCAVVAVCKYWYDVAQDSMSLWGRIKMGPRIGFRRVDVLLARPGVPERGIGSYIGHGCAAMAGMSTRFDPRSSCGASIMAARAYTDRCAILNH